MDVWQGPSYAYANNHSQSYILKVAYQIFLWILTFHLVTPKKVPVRKVNIAENINTIDYRKSPLRLIQTSDDPTATLIFC